MMRIVDSKAANEFKNNAPKYSHTFYAGNLKQTLRITCEPADGEIEEGRSLLS